MPVVEDALFYFTYYPIDIFQFSIINVKLLMSDVCKLLQFYCVKSEKCRKICSNQVVSRSLTLLYSSCYCTAFVSYNNFLLLKVDLFNIHKLTWKGCLMTQIAISSDECVKSQVVASSPRQIPLAWQIILFTRILTFNFCQY